MKKWLVVALVCLCPVVGRATGYSTDLPFTYFYDSETHVYILNGYTYGQVRLQAQSTQPLLDGIYLVNIQHYQTGSYEIDYTFQMSFAVKGGILENPTTLGDYAQSFFWEDDHGVGPAGAFDTSYTVQSVWRYYPGGNEQMSFSSDSSVFTGTSGLGSSAFGALRVLPVVVTVIPPSASPRVAHFYAVFSNADPCPYAMRLVNLASGDDLAYMDIAPGQSGEFVADMEVAGGVQYRWEIVSNPGNGNDVWHPFGDGVVTYPAERGDYFDINKFITLRSSCAASPSPSATANPRATATPGATATANPSATPSGSPQGSPGGSATPGATASATPETFDPGNPGAIDTSGRGKLDDILPQATELNGRVQTGVDEALDELNGLTAPIECFENASFGTVTSLPMPLHEFSPAFPSTMPIPGWAPMVRALALYFFALMWYVTAVRHIMALKPA